MQPVGLITDSRQQQTLLLTTCMAMVCVLWQTVNQQCRA